MERMRARAYGFLRWTEKYIKTDMVYAASGGFWLFAAKGITAIIGLGVSVAFANLMEPEKYGVYKYVFSVLAIAGAFTLSGISTTITRSVARGFEGTFEKGARTAFLWSASTVFILFCASAYYFYQGNSTLGISFLIVGISTPFFASTSLYSNFLAGTERFRAKALYGMLVSLTSSALLASTLFFTNNPAVFVALYCIGNLGTLVFVYWDSIRRFKPNNAVDPNFMNHSAHFSAMGILDTIAANLDRVLAFSQLGGTQLATYAFAQLAPQQLRDVGGIAGSLASPKLTRRPISELKKTLPRKVLLLLAGSVSIATLYALVAPYIFSFLFPLYLDSVVYSQALAFIAAFTLPGVLFTQTLMGHMKKRELYTIKIIPSIVRIISMVALVTTFGIWGIIMGIVLGYAVGWVLLLMAFFNAKDSSLPIRAENTEVGINET